MYLPAHLEAHICKPGGSAFHVIHPIRPDRAGEIQKEARQAVNEFMDSVLADPDFSMVVAVDGARAQSNRIVRADFPLFTIPLPENNLFGLNVGNYRAVADGLWVTLPPLSEGEHTIHIEVSAPNVDVDSSTPGIQGFSQDVTYHLTAQ